MKRHDLGKYCRELTRSRVGNYVQTWANLQGPGYRRILPLGQRTGKDLVAVASTRHSTSGRGARPLGQGGAEAQICNLG